MWEAFKDLIFSWIQGCYSFCADWGLAIIIITVIFRLIITPLMYTQSKSSYRMQKIQPYVNEIKERFADDPTRQSQETQKLYAETKFNPLAGCIPMLIQMPIFIALFQVLREMGERVGDSDFVFYNIIGDLTATPSMMWDQGFATFSPYLILLLIFAVCTFIPTLLQQKGQPKTSQMKTTRTMCIVMSIMMLWIGWSSPAGVLLFWGASSILAIAQQQISLAIVKKKDREEGELNYTIKNDIVVERKVKKKRQSKSR